MALNLYVIRKAPGAGGDFFRGVQKQRPAQYQGLYLVAPDGKVLASHQNFKSDKTWPQEVLADLEPGLKAFGHVEPRHVRRVDPLPGRGIGLRADGGVCLGIYLRLSIRGIPLRELPNPTIDSLVLTADQWKTLAPPKAEGGERWTVPDAVARQFSRVLGPWDENSMPRPAEVRSVHFTGRVLRVADGVAYLEYEGSIAGAHNTQSNKGLCYGDAKLTGVGTYDIPSGQMRSLVWVFDGVYQAPPPYDKPKQRYSGVVEWRREQARP